MTTATLTTAQTWTVPVGITSIYVVCRAEKGGSSAVPGGLGGLVRGTMAVTPGQVLTFALLPGGAGGGSEGSPAYTAGAGGRGVYFGPTPGSGAGLYAGGGGGGGASSGDDPGTHVGGIGGNGGGETGVGETAPGETAFTKPGAGGAFATSGTSTGLAGATFLRAENELGNGAGGGGGGGGYRGGGGGAYGYVNTPGYPAGGGGGGGGGSNYIGSGVAGGESFPAASNTFTPSVEITYTNPAPAAPLLQYPTGNVVLNRALTQRLSWVHSDTGSDPQSKYDLRYRLTGAGSWTDVTGVTANAFHDIAGGTLAAGAYEWQVRTYDSLGTAGPYSGSEFFTAASVPAGPTITDPLNGATVATATRNVTWSHPDQDAYQLRTVADVAGSPDTGTVYSDSGVVESSGARSRAVSFPVNGRAEHVQIRVRKSTLWSAWTSARYLIAYTPPAATVLTLVGDDATGSVQVVLTAPTPSGGQPVVTSSAVEVEALTGRDTTRPVGTVVRLADGLPASTTWTDWAPASGVEYRYRAVVTGANGSVTTGPWQDLLVDDFSDLFTDLYV